MGTAETCYYILQSSWASVLSSLLCFDSQRVSNKTFAAEVSKNALLRKIFIIFMMAWQIPLGRTRSCLLLFQAQHGTLQSLWCFFLGSRVPGQSLGPRLLASQPYTSHSSTCWDSLLLLLHHHSFNHRLSCEFLIASQTLKQSKTFDHVAENR